MIVFERKGENERYHPDIRMEVGLNWETTISELFEYFCVFLNALGFTLEQIDSFFDLSNHDSIEERIEEKEDELP